MALSYQNYTGDNTTTQFSIPFTYQNTAEISVTVDGVAETGLTFPSSSTVQLTSAPASGTLVQVRRTTNLAARAVDFASGSVLTEEDLDDSNIQVFHAAQESTDLAGDSIQLGNDNKWDAQSSVIKNVGTPTASTDAATKAYTDTEVAGVVSSAVTQATAAATTTAQAEVAAATSTIIPDATKLAIHPIGTQYTLSDGVTTDYSSKHYANVASTNATTATNAASTASTDAGTASSAATAAQVAQAAAEAALDTFDDRFLGAKASNPSVDNDGNALLDGAIYFNTTSDIMKVYDATNTVWHDLALTGTDQTNVNLVAGQISPTNNIGTLAGISSDITTVAGNNANVTTVATNIANVNAVGTDIANVNTVATNLTSVNAFADTYFISPTAPASPTLGDLWFDTTNDIMKVYSASGFVNAGSSVNGTANRYVYTATSGQTSFAATYDAGYVDVYLNGVKLQNGTDFTATDGANVVLTVGAAQNDQIDIVGYGTFNIAIPDISGDLTPQLGGDLATSGNDITFGDNDKAIFGAGSDLQIYHDGLTSYISDQGTGNLKILAQNFVVSNPANNKTMMAADPDAAATISYDGAIKLATTATGIDVTGGLNTTDFDVIPTSSANYYPQIGGGVDGSADAYLALSGGTSGNGNLAIQARGTYGEIKFYTGGSSGSASTTERLRIDSSGNVGIGTSSPATATGGGIDIERAGGASVRLDDTTNSVTGELQVYSSGMNLATVTNHNMLFSTNNSERMRIDSAGRISINTTAATELLNVAASAGNGAGVEFAGNGTTVGSTSAFYGQGSGSDAYVWNRANNSILFGTNNAEKMRLDSSGNVGIGTSNAQYNGIGAPAALTAFNNGLRFGANFGASTTVSQYAVVFSNPNGQIGGINVGGTSTSYVTSSDYRLKTAVEYDWDATSRLKQLKPARFAWITDADTTVDGFLAHEVQDIVPEAISGTKDAMMDEEYEVTPAVLDEDGNEVTPAVIATRSVPDYQGIDQSKLTPLLTKALIEAVEKIEQLEARITALENV